MRFRLKPAQIAAEQFFPDRKPWPAGVEPQPCFCADLAQDGRRCEAHKENGRRYGIVDVGSLGARRKVEINRGDWLIVLGLEHGHYPIRAVMTDARFRAAYEPDEPDEEAARA
jgi:hypothetical protein